MNCRVNKNLGTDSLALLGASMWNAAAIDLRFVSSTILLKRG